MGGHGDHHIPVYLADKKHEGQKSGQETARCGVHRKLAGQLYRGYAGRTCFAVQRVHVDCTAVHRLCEYHRRIRRETADEGYECYDCFVFDEHHSHRSGRHPREGRQGMAAQFHRADRNCNSDQHSRGIHPSAFAVHASFRKRTRRVRYHGADQDARAGGLTGGVQPVF